MCVGGFVCVSVWVWLCVCVCACVQESRVCAWWMFRLVFLLANKSDSKVFLSQHFNSKMMLRGGRALDC